VGLKFIIQPLTKTGAPRKRAKQAADQCHVVSLCSWRNTMAWLPSQMH